MNILDYILEYTSILSNEQIGELVNHTKSLLAGKDPKSFSSVAVQAAFLAIKVAHTDNLKKEAEKEAEREQGRKNAQKRWKKNNIPNDTPYGEPMGSDHTPNDPLMGTQWGANGAPMGGHMGAITQEEKDFSLIPSSPSSSPTPPTITPISPKTLLEKEEGNGAMSKPREECEEKEKKDFSSENSASADPKGPSPLPLPPNDAESRKREFGLKLQPFTGKGKGLYPRKLINEFFLAWTKQNEGETTFPFERVPGGFEIAVWLEMFEAKQHSTDKLNKQINGNIGNKQTSGAVNLNDGRKREYISTDILGPEDFPE